MNKKMFSAFGATSFDLEVMVSADDGCWVWTDVTAEKEELRQT